MEVEKQAVSVAEMARMVGLSRARFYQLVVSGRSRRRFTT